MEKTYNIQVKIPVNDFTIPTEPDQEVVQEICDAFLGGWRYCVPTNANKGTHYVGTFQGKGMFSSCLWSHEDGKKATRNKEIHGCDMKAAFQALRKAGYHMFVRYSMGGDAFIRCRKEPYFVNGEEITTFDFNVDFA
jgi:hypothetical protein